MTMTLIETVTVGSGGAASITFSNIPQDGTDLVVLVSIRSTSASFNRNLLTRFNGTTTDVYSSRYLQGFGTGGVGSGADSSGQGTFVWPSQNQGTSTTASTFANLQIYVANYASNLAKSVSVDAVTENNGGSAIQGIHAGLYNLTTAVTSITILDGSFNFAQHTTASLYKITKA